jgi:hypothetical protein
MAITRQIIQFSGNHTNTNSSSFNLRYKLRYFEQPAKHAKLAKQVKKLCQRTSVCQVSRHFTHHAAVILGKFDIFILGRRDL